MTVQNSTGIPYYFAPEFQSLSAGNALPTASDATVDATGEYVHLLGHCMLDGKTGSKTISSAGGKIHFLVGAATITFANVGTNLRVGIQDVSTSGAAGRGDGTFDVYDDLVGGTDTLTALTWKTVTMSSGTKTIAHGDKIAVVIGMTARGGTDTMKVRSVANLSGTLNAFPPVTLETAGPTFTAQAALPNVVIEFDDGTFGYLFGSWVTSTGAITTALAVNSGSTPDEYCNIIRFPYPVNVYALTAMLGPANSANDFELILYSDPLGTPSVIETITFDASNLTGTTSARPVLGLLTTVRSLSANTNYGVAIRPTTGGSVNIATFDVSASGHWSAHDMGSNCYLASRTNQTGAFSGTTTQRVVGLSVGICGFDDGASGGGPSAPSGAGHIFGA